MNTLEKKTRANSFQTLGQKLDVNPSRSQEQKFLTTLPASLQNEKSLLKFKAPSKDENLDH